MTILRTKAHLKLSKVKLTISVYYTLEVGFQESTFIIKDSYKNKYLIVSHDYPYETNED